MQRCLKCDSQSSDTHYPHAYTLFDQSQSGQGKSSEHIVVGVEVSEGALAASHRS